MNLATIRTKNSMPSSLARTDLERKCLKQGVRVTYTRRIILSVLDQAQSHLTVEDIYRLIQTTDEMSLSTIYSNIRGLVAAGVIERRQFQSKHSYYSGSHSQPQDQLVDIESGTVIEFRNAALDQLKADIAQEYGFSIEDCRVEFYSRTNK